MIPALAVRITLPFSDASGIVRVWALKAEKLVCYEHIGEATSKPHIHLLLIRVGCDKERLKQLAKPWATGSGNEFWSFKTKCKGIGDVNEENSFRYLVYMTKGTIDPSYVKGYEMDWLQSAKNAWSAPTEELNRNQKLYESFEEYLWQTWDKCSAAARAEYFQDGYTILRSDAMEIKGIELARRWSFGINKSIWSVRAAADAKMVFLTYCMTHDLRIPSNVKVW